MALVLGLTGFLLLAAAAAGPEQRAVDYLAKEVPNWARDNGCYSCHNNGDAARALFAARRAGMTIPTEVLEGTIAWLRDPAKWSETHGNAGVTNVKLANVQFGAALLDSGEGDREVVIAAARALAALQDADGSWKVDAGGLAGAPTTYGAALATYMGRRVLMAAGSTVAAERATAWLRKAAPEHIVDAAAIVLALPERRDAVERLRRAQNRDGGWGETFDTAMAILALHRVGDKAAVERGRAALLRLQQAEGGWPETTRPPGNISYAEHISTTGWALYALLETAGK